MDSAEREALAASVLARSDADETEAIVFASDSGLTRFTHNAIHQNVASDNVAVRVRVVVDGREGVASTNDIGDTALAQTVERACSLARLAPRSDGRLPMVAAKTVPTAAHAFVRATALATADRRAEIARDIFAVA